MSIRVEPCGYVQTPQCCPCWEEASQAERDRAFSLASEIIWRLSGRRFGLCEITVRPCRDSCSGYRHPLYGALQPGQLSSPWVPALIEGEFYNLRACGGCPDSACCGTCALSLKGPVDSITRVEINGETIEPSEYRVDNHGLLVRQEERKEGTPTTLTLANSQDVIPFDPNGRWCVAFPQGASLIEADPAGEGCWDVTSGGAYINTGASQRLQATWTGDQGVTTIPVVNGTPHPLPPDRIVAAGGSLWADRIGDWQVRYTVVSGQVNTTTTGRAHAEPGTTILVEVFTFSDGCWPECQDLDAKLGANNTWAVTYMVGTPLPPGGVAAVNTLACELLYACNPKLGPCRLPQRVQSITRQGVSMTLMDSGADLWEHGKTGLPEIDLWLRSLRVSTGARVYSIDTIDDGRHRQTTWTP